MGFIFWFSLYFYILLPLGFLLVIIFKIISGIFSKENYGYSGKVIEVCGGTIINNFYWSYDGSKCELKSS
ncbi:hypothetical protein [Clostridium botulinum]|uniref:hypothetical protein n=1 Tax=Clostridium botulinum TaxID=1491 RepID=UPI000772E7D5|nr:hypothetical protein [Clostridium botulinum]NFL39288.1 hypothetical protein [Clostridium botulinum]NFL65834.1 hypothetical protein [Clostridium botulinum]